MLLGLLAPRPVFLQTGSTDKWSDPKGEFLAAKAASPIYALFDKIGLASNEMLKMSEPILSGSIAYSMHEGGHGTLPTDYKIIIEFLTKNL